MKYVTFDDIVALARREGIGSLIFKTDIVEAFKLVPLTPDDIQLCGVLYKGKYYINTRLVFGVRSGPYLFGRTASAVVAIFRIMAECPDLMNLLDDFFTVTEGRDAITAALYLHTLVLSLTTLGIPTSAAKTEGPSTVMTLLGVQIDTDRSLITVPPVRMEAVRSLLTVWDKKTVVTKRDLQVLIGVLSFCCYAVRTGRTFLRRLIDLTSTLKYQRETTVLTFESRQDIEWWKKFAPLYDGVSTFVDPKPVETRALGFTF